MHGDQAGAVGDGVSARERDCAPRPEAGEPASERREDAGGEDCGLWAVEGLYDGERDDDVLRQSVVRGAGGADTGCVQRCVRHLVHRRHPVCAAERLSAVLCRDAGRAL